jgi:hypothetical protein
MDPARLAAMRGEPDGDEAPAGGDAAPEAEDTGPTPEKLEAAGRMISAMKLGDRRALCAALDDYNGG